MSLKSLRYKYPVAFGVAVAVCTIAVMAASPAQENALVDDVVRTGVAACLAAGLYAASGGSSLPASGEAREPRRTPATTIVVCALLVYAAAICAAGFALGVRTAEFSPAYVGLLALPCAATGIFEEALFRGFLFDGFAQAMTAGPRLGALAKAALCTSALFALLHVVRGNPASAIIPVPVWIVLKFAEAMAFGLAMCYLRARGFKVWPLAALHAGFDFLYFL